MKNPCSTCDCFVESCAEYQYGACLHIQRISKNLSVDPVNLEFHGTAGCDKWVKSSRPLTLMALDDIQKPAEPITDEEIPF